MTHPAVRAADTTANTSPETVWGIDGRPLVTVVIIMFNDIANVGTAIRSALDQTLKGTEVIVVDDCSTDGSFEYVSELARDEPRLRVFQTPKNSGGPGAPRNIGMDNASAPYLTFLDSDDILERHATYNLLTAAERSEADIVMAKTRRRDIAKKKFRGWHHRLYREEQHFDTIEENPELCIDTIAVAKLYRMEMLRANGIRFREELHYEDLIFTAEVFAKAEGIRVIPEFVYQWNLYPIKVRKSITNQRDDIRNLQHRKVALAEVLRVADPAAVPALHARLQLKILRHDARLYLNDIAHGQVPNLAPELLAELKPLIESIPTEIYADVPRDDRLLVASALAEDVDLVSRMAHIASGTWDLYGDWEPGGQRSLWEPETFAAYPADSREHMLATFDAAEVVAIPWYAFKFYNAVDAVAIDGKNRVTISGRIPDSFAKLDRPDLTARMLIRERWGFQREWVAPVRWERTADGEVEWTTEFEFPSAIDRAVRPKISIRMELTNGTASTLLPLRVKKGFVGSKQKTQPHGVAESLANIRYQPYATEIGTLAFRLARIGKQRRRLRRAIKPLLSTGQTALRDRYVPLPSHALVAEGERIAAEAREQLDDRLVVVESHMGTTESDSPHVLAAELRRTRPDLRIVVVAAANQRWAAGREDVVIRNTVDYYRTLARAKYIIDNQTLPVGYVKRPGQVYIQTWHGIPIKKMGFDEPSLEFGAREDIADLERRVGYWDFLSIPSAYFRDTFVPAFRYEHAQLPVGSPRNDVLVSDTAGIAAAKARLDLDPAKTSVLYAPTFRTRGQASLELDLTELVDDLGEDYQILLRPHYLNRIAVPPHLRGRVIDVSGIADTAQVLQAADILVSDYSSIIFDYLSLDRPIILYAYDLDDYANSARGTYFDLRDHRPGPLVTDQEELVAAIRAAGDDEAEPLRRRFREDFVGTEPGDAAATTIATIWGAQ